MREQKMVILNFIDKRKNDYNCHLASKLNNPKTSIKTYWSIVKSFYSGKKILLTPLLLYNSTLITDLKQKVDLFNIFRPNHSRTNQLLCIFHNLYSAFDADPTLEVRGVFLDMSKV